MFIVIWHYSVKEGKERDFELAYGVQGEWVRLFRTAPGYHGTELLHDAHHPSDYVTIDRWVDRESYESFMNDSKKEYERIDSRHSVLTTSEQRVGSFLDLHQKQ